MAATLWIVGILLLVDGIALMLLRRRGMLGNLPWFVPQLSLGGGAVCLIAAIITTGSTAYRDRDGFAVVPLALLGP